MAGWYIKRGEKVVGPVDLSKLKELVADRRLHPSDLLAKDLAGPWNEAGRTTLFAVPVTVHKGMLGGHTLSYDCPSCSAALKSKLDDAGNQDTCPECGRPYVVPGIAERNRIHDEEEAIKEQKRLVKQQEQQALPPRLVAQVEQELPLQSVDSAPGLQVVQKHEPSSLSETRSCPFCGEKILLAAKKCKHCGEFLDETVRSTHVKTQTIELTGKRFKLMQLLGVLGILLGGPGMFIGMQLNDQTIAVISFLALAIGVLLYPAGRVGAWWYHG